MYRETESLLIVQSVLDMSCRLPVMLLSVMFDCELRFAFAEMNRPPMCYSGAMKPVESVL